MPNIEERVITHPEDLEACCAHLASTRRFGLDTEFVGEDSYHPRLCLVQVATEDTLYLIDPFSAGPLDSFWKIVVDPSNEVIVHAGREEVRLCHLWSGQTPGNLFDLQIAAGLVGLNYPLGHGTLVNQVLGIQLGKGETLTEWRSRPLTKSQISYAFDDVRYLLQLGAKLTERLQSLNRMDWAQEEFSRLAAYSNSDEFAPVTAPERWRKLSGLGSLDRRRLAIARALHFWREQTAEDLNRPARSLLRDDLIVEIARRNPSRPRDLQVVRGLAHRFVDGILKAVEQARTLPIEECPQLVERDQDPAQVGLATNILNAVLIDFAARHQVAANLIAASQDVRLLVRAHIQGAAQPEILLTRGWRRQHVLPDLLAVLEGRRSLRIADLSKDAPFSFSDEK